MAEENDLEATLEKGMAHREETRVGAREEIAMERRMGARVAHTKTTNLVEREEGILGRKENRNRENRKGQSVGKGQETGVEERVEIISSAGLERTQSARKLAAAQHSSVQLMI